MNDIEITATSGVLGGFLAWFLGPIDGLVQLLLVMIVVDYVSGVFKGIARHELSSRIGAKGIEQKVMILVLVGLAHLLDNEIPGDSEVMRDVVIFFYLSNEGISILENAIELGLPVPAKMKEVLKRFQEEK